MQREAPFSQRKQHQLSLIRLERIVTGYHGTSVRLADAILKTGTFVPSKNDWDWLGHGAYFWEYAPGRAWQWAGEKHGPDAAVLEAEIELGFCLDLTDVEYTSVVRLSYEKLREAFIAAEKPLPVNRGKARYLDCLVINYLATYVLPECDTVRAPFLEGKPIYDGSMLLTQSHIQLVVRNHACIKHAEQLMRRC